MEVDRIMAVTLAKTPAHASELYAELGRPDIVAWDTETTGLRVRNRVDYPRIIQFSWRPWEHALVVPVTDEFMPIIRQIFMATSEMVAHNTKFDMHAMHNVGVPMLNYFKPHQMHDTIWVARLYDERTSAKLKDLGTRYLSDTAASAQAALKRKMKKHGYTWANVPVSYLVEYGGQDAVMTGQLFDMLKPKIKYAEGAYRREQDLMPILYRMERKGLTVDSQMLHEQNERFQREAEEAEAFMVEHYGGLNPRSPMQVKAAFREAGLEVPNTRAATLRMVAAGHKFDGGPEARTLAEKMLEYRGAHKAYSTYTSSWVELTANTGRLHPWFNSMGAKTGRFSSSDPNLQNIKRGHELRDIFIAEEGHQMVVADWNQMELRLYAHFAQDENMIAAFLSGDDIYQQASDLLGVPRQVGKMIMLASIYGAGPRALKRQCINMAIKDGDFDLITTLEGYDWGQLYDDFHDRYRIKQLAQKTETVARSRLMDGDPHIRTVGGRRQRPKLIFKKKVNGRKRKITLFKDMANSLVQGSCADMMKQAMIDVDRAGVGDYLRLTVHDEMVAEVPDEDVAEVEAIMVEKMYRGEYNPPLTVEAQHAKRYGDAK